MSDATPFVDGINWPIYIFCQFNLILKGGSHLTRSGSISAYETELILSRSTQNESFLMSHLTIRGS